MRDPEPPSGGEGTLGTPPSLWGQLGPSPRCGDTRDPQGPSPQVARGHSGPLPVGPGALRDPQEPTPHSGGEGTLGTLRDPPSCWDPQGPPPLLWGHSGPPPPVGTGAPHDPSRDSRGPLSLCEDPRGSPRPWRGLSPLGPHRVPVPVSHGGPAVPHAVLGVPSSPRGVPGVSVPPVPVSLGPVPPVPVLAPCPRGDVPTLPRHSRLRHRWDRCEAGAGRALPPPRVTSVSLCHPPGVTSVSL